MGADRPSSGPHGDDSRAAPQRWPRLIPVGVFVLLAGAFLYALQAGDPSRLPSALIGKPVPEFTLPPVDGLLSGGQPIGGFSSKDLAAGQVSVVNVWASWCIPCHEEHKQLEALTGLTKAALYGINYKDDPGEARRFLGRFGNPFQRVGADSSGRVAIDWGVYGVPETFVIDGRGRIAYKHVGPLTMESLQAMLLPEIAKATAAK